MPKFCFEERQEKDPELIIIPLVDVMLFLLAFFVLIMGAVIPGLRIKTTLPQTISKGNQTSKSIPLNIVIVTIKATGEVFVGDRKVKNLEDLKRALKNAKKSGINYLIINADKTVPVQNIITVMDLAKELGITKVGILTRGKNEKENK